MVKARLMYEGQIDLKKKKRKAVRERETREGDRRGREKVTWEESGVGRRRGG